MLKRLLTKKRYFKNIYKEQKGITGLETAIILIAFVVVAAVFAYTVLSAGLFSTQKSQEAVYSGLEETQNTIDLKGAVVANGVAMLENCDYVAWTAGGTITMTRETTEKWEGSASLKAVVPSTTAANTVVVYHDLPAMDLTVGDTFDFWMKADAAIGSNLTLILNDTADLVSPIETYAINPSGTGWEKFSFDLAAGNAADDAIRYIVIYVDTLIGGAAGTFYLDNVMFEDVASQNGIPCSIDNCDYPLGWATGDAANIDLTRDTVTNTTPPEKIEGTASVKAVIDAAAAAGAVIMSHDMQPKTFSAGQTISFWVLASDAAALDSKISFHLNDSSDLDDTPIETQLIGDISNTAWTKVTLTLTGTDTAAAYYGFVLTNDAAGTIYVDDIEISDASLNNNTDPMNAFANTVSFTVALANGGNGVDFTGTTDADKDGILSDELLANRHHKVIIYYNDEYQQLTDLAWTATPIGRDNGNAILDTGEKFLITVDLTYVNQNAGVWASSKIGNNQTFTLEIKPPTGAVLTIERTMPPKVATVNNLN